MGPDSLSNALIILAGASISAGLAWTGFLLIRYPRLWQVTGGVLLKACGFAGIRLLRGACIWLAFVLMLDPQADLLTILIAVAAGCAPLLLSFLHFVPYFGWLVLGLLEIISFVRTVDLVNAATTPDTAATWLTCAASWLLVWVVVRVLDSAALSLGAHGSGARPRHPRRLTVEEIISALPAKSTSWERRPKVSARRSAR